MTGPVAIQFLLCPIVLVVLMFITAPYGRHFTNGWGPRLDNRLAWFCMELPAVAVIAWIVLQHPSAQQPIVWIPLVFWQFHYLYRTFLFPALMRSSRKTFPGVVVLAAIAFNVLNGYNNAHALIDPHRAEHSIMELNFMLGAMLFWSGFALHISADRIIRQLRPTRSDQYGIPRGLPFRWTSNPNYLGEILQWTGWAILISAWAGWAFALFTFCNLLPRAISNHAWYEARFPDYPKKRYVLIPGLF